MALIVEVQQSYVARADRKYTEFVPATVVARGRANYVVIDTETGRAPEGLNLTRLGDDLQITRGQDEVFIKDYFVYEGSALIGPVGADTYATFENPGFNLIEWMGLRDGLQLKPGESTMAELSDERLEAPWLAADNSSSAFSSLLIPVLTSVAATVVGFFAIQEASDSDDNTENSVTNSLRAPTNLVVAADGLSVSGEGSTGSGVTVFDSAGNRLGASTVSGAGTFTVNLALPQTAGQSLNVRAALGDQVSSLVPITAPVGQNGPISQVVDLDPATNVIAENSAIGSTVGITAQASDFEAISYALVNNPSQFSIDPLSGVITTAEVIDFEAITSSPLVVTVRATSADGSFNDTNFNINVTNLNDNEIGTPTDANAAANQIDVNSAIGSDVGVTVRAIDADGALNQVRYELLDNAGGRFNINATTGQILTATDLSAQAGTYQVQAQASSSDGSVSQAFFSIDVVTADQVQPTAVI